MPHTLRRVSTDDETLAELTVLAGYDDDLAAQSTRLTNRLRDALLHVHPALERLLGPRMDRGGVLDLLAAAPTAERAARAATHTSDGSRRTTRARLLYVAITRARSSWALISPANDPSPLLTEIGLID
jgi:hypothetical protein